MSKQFPITIIVTSEYLLIKGASHLLKQSIRGGIDA